MGRIINIKDQRERKKAMEERYKESVYASWPKCELCGKAAYAYGTKICFECNGRPIQ